MTNTPKIALVTMTRDRLAYTQHCFATLEANAGCDYDHYVFDQASTDGTGNWLPNWRAQGNGRSFYLSNTNVGICAAANRTLDLMVHPERYDVIVRYDNDCEVTQPGTLKACAETAYDFGAIVAPRVLGLKNPPPTIKTVSLGGKLLDTTAILGGIFMCIPAFLFSEQAFRWSEHTPFATGDEAIVPWWRARGGTAGYLQGWTVNHYETTEGQKARYPAYEQRKTRELTAR